MDGLQKASRVFHSFITMADVTFEGQEPGEVVLLVLRAHPITQLPWIFNSIVLILVLVILNFVYPLFLLPNQIVFVNLFSFAIIFAYIWFNFLSWFFNVGVVTNKKIVDIDFTNILHKEVTAARLKSVEQVTSKSSGYFGSLFNYGNVFVETAAEQVNIEFLKVPFPTEVVEIINHAVGRT